MRARCSRARAGGPRRSGPWPCVVVANGRPWRSMTSRSSDGSARRIADEPMTAIGRLAAAISSPARAIAASGARRESRRVARRRRHRLVGRRERHVLRQVEMHRPHRLAQRERDRLASASRRCGPRSSRSVALVIGLNSAWWSIHIWMRRPSWSVLRLQVMRDHRRAVEEGAADAGREIGGAWSERRDAQPRRAGQAAADVGREAGRALMRGQHEIDARPCAWPPSAAARCRSGCQSRGGCRPLSGWRRSDRRCSLGVSASGGKVLWEVFWPP